MKRVIVVILVSISLISFSCYSQDVKIDVLFYKVLKSRKYYTGSGYYYPPNKNEGFIEVRLRFTNNSKNTVVFDVNDVAIEGNGELRGSSLILGNTVVNVYKKSKVKIKPNMLRERKVIYSFPLSKKADKLIIKNIGIVPLEKNNKIKMDTVYYYQDFKKVKHKSNATFSQIYHQIEPNKWASTEYYYPSRVLKRYKELKFIYPEKKDGKFESYYENGQLKEKGIYHNGYPTGELILYYESGLKKRQENYIGNERLIQQFWNEKGEAKLIFGKGFIESKETKKNIRIEKIIDNKISASFLIRKIQKDSIYDIVDKKPEFPKGMSEFYNYVSKNIKYPIKARNMGIEGKVFVQFILGKNGRVQEVSVLKGIGSGCDDESVRIMISSPKWFPGWSEGIPVKTRMIIPLTFKLGRK